jgi:hypothetical protein
MCNLDNFDAILNITFIDSNWMDVLRGGCKLKVITRLIDKLVSLNIEYQANL